MKTKIDHLLACIGEECGEIQQVIGKATRFGLYDTNPANNTPNAELLRAEIHDLLAVYEMLCEETGRDKSIDTDTIAHKKQRVLHFMEYAKEVGQLEEG